MKNYFDFRLTGKKFLPVWLAYMLLFLAPYLTLVISMQDIQPGAKPPMMFFPSLIGLILIAFVIAFFIAKLVIENIIYNQSAISFKGTAGKFIGTAFLGFFLTIITLGIYMPWFIRNLHRFFVDNSSLNSNEFKFNGKAGKLFVILLLTLFLPMIAFVSVVSMLAFKNPESAQETGFVFQAVMMIILVPYMYYVYKWMVDINYKEYHIKWDTNFWNACGKIALEVLLSMITLGIYFPLALVRLYEYFADKTVAASSENQMKFGYDIDQKDDFLFIWGQALLTIITVGIYYPWAFCKVGKRIMTKTYLEKE